MANISLREIEIEHRDTDVHIILSCDTQESAWHIYNDLRKQLNGSELKITLAKQ